MNRLQSTLVLIFSSLLVLEPAQAFLGQGFFGVQKRDAYPVSTSSFNAYYDFSSNLTDGSGNSRTGTATGTLSYTNGSEGAFTSALTGTTATDYAKLPASINLAGNFTVNVWVKTTATSGRIWAKLGGDQSAGTHGCFFEARIFILGTGRIRFNVGSTTVWQFQALDSSSSINDGQWHMITASVSASTMYLSIDGGTPTSTSITWPRYSTSPYEVYLGGEASTGTGGPPANIYSGAIDNLSFFSRALSSDEISDLYRLNY